MTDPLEIAATLLTLICVVLAVKRNLWQFPTGIAGTALGFFVFWHARLYSSAALQPVFIAVQIYGWWYWLRGEDQQRPRIKSTSPAIVAGACLVALGVAAAAAWALDTFTNANMALADATIFALSIVAQVLLSRKRIENWPVWIVINAISVFVYASQALWLYTALYVFFFFNAFWGWWEWRKEMRGYSGAERTNPA
ncbi:MAG TPA: nicotinamide riboside transporter PnuC [Hyphomonadaceae bacterium]|nr:nicotinamide riboside transporter PnuC [Hyphomonadaceae bacterium]